MKKNIFTKTARRIIRRFGIDVVWYQPKPFFPADFRPHEVEIIEAVRPFTLTVEYPERIVTLIRAIEHIVRNDIPGDIVECGVWKGGSMMAIAMTLLRLQDTNRKLHLFDTFEGMTTPGDVDINFRGRPAQISFDRLKKSDGTSNWVFASLEEVKRNMENVGYDTGNIVFVKGKVEETLPAAAPDRIALLRLDTDWYESTAHELQHLYPRLLPGGVLIVDDYGHWMGSQKAVDEYFGAGKTTPFLNRIDFAARLIIKP